MNAVCMVALVASSGKTKNTDFVCSSSIYNFVATISVTLGDELPADGMRSAFTSLIAYKRAVIAKIFAIRFGPAPVCRTVRVDVRVPLPLKNNITL